MYINYEFEVRKSDPMEKSFLENIFQVNVFCVKG